MKTRPAHSLARLTLSYWLAGAAFSAYICRQSLGVVESTVRADLSLSEEDMGLAMGMFFWSYALAQLPGGLLGQRFGSRRMIPIYIVTWSLGTACWGLAGGFWGLLIGRILVGIAQAGVFPCSTISISRWYPKSERARASAALGAAMQVGQASAAFLTVYLLRFLSWREIFVSYAIPGTALAAGFYYWFRDDPAVHASVSEEELNKIRADDGPKDNRPKDNAPKDNTRKDNFPWAEILTNRSLWLLNIQQFFRAAGAVWFASWFATYLQETREVSQEKSGWLTGLIFLMGFVGTLSSGALSDFIYKRTGSLDLARRGVASTCLFLCSALVFSAYWIADPILASATIALGVFFATFAGPCSYAAAIDMGGKNVAPVFAMMNMIGNFGAGLLPMIVPPFRKYVSDDPWLLAAFGGNSWNAVLVLFASMFLLAGLAWALLKIESVKE
jgi:sugar phosphate permease